ncbi:hypothetical protein Bca4012_026522 [Brassica carinata]
MVRGGATTRGRGRGIRGRGVHAREETVEMTAESTHNGVVWTTNSSNTSRRTDARCGCGSGSRCTTTTCISTTSTASADANQDPRHDYWKVLKLMREMGTTTFNDETDPVVADNWKKHLERNFENVRCPLEYKVELATSFLLGEAQIWWEEFVRGAPPGYIVPWTTFREEFDRKYFLQEALDKLEMEFLSLT